MAEMKQPNNGTPDIPTLQEKKKEQKGGAVVVGQSGGSPGVLYRWFGIGGQGAAGGAARVGAGAASKAVGGTAAKAVAGGAIAAAPKYGLVPTLINFVSSNLGMAALSMALTGGAVYTLYNLGMKATDGQQGKARVFAKHDRADPEIGPAGETRVDASGLSYFQTANTGKAFGDEEEPVAGEGEDELADAAAEEGNAEEELESADEAVDEASGGAPDLDESMVKKEKGKFVLAKGMSARGAGSGIKGGTGMAGGFSQPFQKTTRLKKAEQGQITAKPARKRGKLSARKMSSANRAGKGAMNQLKFSSKKSRGALGQTSAEGADFQAAEAFSAAPIGAGAKGIAGGGLSSGGDGITPASDGGPIGNNTVNPEQDAPDTGKGKDKSPWTQMVMMSMALLTTASTIITIIGILSMIDKVAFGLLQPVIQMLLGIATGMAGAATAMGVQIMTEHGQQEQGAILTTGGAITTATAMAALIWPTMPSWVLVIGGIAGIAAAVGGLLSGGGMGGM